MRHKKIAILIVVAIFLAFAGTAYLEGLEIKGNAPAMIYHFPGCPSYNSVKMKAEEGDTWFVSEEAARKAGFTRAKNCPN